MAVSVITVCLDPGDLIARTLASLAGQTHRAMQWIVIDGGSHDGTLDRLRGGVRQPDILVSEPDRGIADAFNKGLAQATGEAVWFMNAGDEFASPTSLADLVAAWDRTRYRWITGSTDVVGQDGSVLFRRSFRQQPRDPMTLVRHNCQIMHQAVLAERSLFDELGGFDERWRIAMDYDLWVRWISRGFAPQCCTVPVSRFHRGGASGDPLRNIREERAVRVANGIPNGWMTDTAIELLARAKRLARGRYGRPLYRLKEALGLRW